jgi:hypothetical protein
MIPDIELPKNWYLQKISKYWYLFYSDTSMIMLKWNGHDWVVTHCGSTIFTHPLFHESVEFVRKWLKKHWDE